MPGRTAGGTLPAPVPSSTSPLAPLASEARRSRSSDPAARTCRSTAVTRRCGRRTGPRAAGAWKRGRPRSRTPTGPRALRKASSRCVCALRTRAAAWISSPNTTRAPRPLAPGWAAVRTAAVRFAGPSQPGSEKVRMAPVRTTGFGPATVRSRRYAVSSRVSVPCVITTPSTRGSARTSSTRRRRRHIHAGVTCGPGSRARSSRRRRASRRSPGTRATISRPERAGRAAPVAGSRRMEMVPPVKRTWTTARSLTGASRGRGRGPRARRRPRPGSTGPAPRGRAATRGARRGRARRGGRGPPSGRAGSGATC